MRGGGGRSKRRNARFVIDKTSCEIIGSSLKFPHHSRPLLRKEGRRKEKECHVQKVSRYVAATNVSFQSPNPPVDIGKAEERVEHCWQLTIFVVCRTLVTNRYSSRPNLAI